MSWITDLIDGFGLLLGGGAVLAIAALIVIDVPGPLKPWALCALAVVAGVLAFKYEESKYASCQTAMAEFSAKAEKLKADAIESAKKESDRDLAVLQTRLDDQGRTLDLYTARINADAVNKKCPPSPAAVDASLGVRAIVTRPGAGQTDAQRSPTPRLSRSKAGPGPAPGR